MTFPIYGKIKNGNQTTNQLLFLPETLERYHHELRQKKNLVALPSGHGEDDNPLGSLGVPLWSIFNDQHDLVDDSYYYSLPNIFNLWFKASSCIQWCKKSCWRPKSKNFSSYQRPKSHGYSSGSKTARISSKSSSTSSNLGPMVEHAITTSKSGPLESCNRENRWELLEKKSFNDFREFLQLPQRHNALPK